MESSSGSKDKHGCRQQKSNDKKNDAIDAEWVPPSLAFDIAPILRAAKDIEEMPFTHANIRKLNPKVANSCEYFNVTSVICT